MHALGFHASVRVRLKSVGKIKKKVNGVDSIIGVQTRAIVTKNRLGPPQREADFEIYFDRGVDDYASWLKTLKQFNIIGQGGAWYSYDLINQETGEVQKEYKFQAKDFAQLMDDDTELRNLFYSSICESMIMKYRSEDLEGESAEIIIDDVDE